MACSVLINKWTIECDINLSQAYVSSKKDHGIISYQDRTILKVYDTSALDGENNFVVQFLDNNCFIKVNFNEKIIRIILKSNKQ